MGLVAKRSLGISFGPGTATVTEVRKHLGRVLVTRTGVLTFPESGDGLRLESLEGTAPENGRKKHHTNLPSLEILEEVVVGLPSRTFLLRFLELPDLDDAELSSLLTYELECHIPFAPEEAWYGFQKLGRYHGKAQVMLAVAKRVEVERYLAMVEKIGFHPTAVSVSLLAALNAFLFYQRQRREEVHSLIHLSGREAGISVMRDGVLLSSRTVALREGSFDAVFAELKRIARVIPRGPGKVFVTGESDGLCPQLKEELDIAAEPWRLSWPSVSVSAFGLALSGLVKLPVQINLLPAERRKTKRERAVKVMFALLGLLAILGVAFGMSAAYQERKTLRWLDERLAEVKAESASVAALRRDFMQLEDKVRLLDSLREKQTRPLSVLKELAQLLPTSVSLNELSMQEEKVRIRGSTDSSAAELISVFERSSLFENAAFTSPISTRGKDQQQFQIEVSVKSLYPAPKQRSKPGSR